MADHPDLEQLLTENLPALRAFVRLRSNRAIREHESHSDLVQSVCREVLAGADRLEYQGDAAFRGWLFTTALRKIVERDRYLHADKRDVARNLAADVAGAAAAGASEGLLAAYATVTTPSAVLPARERMASLERAFDELPDDRRHGRNPERALRDASSNVTSTTAGAGRAAAELRQRLGPAQPKLRDGR